ncbi:MAG: thiol-disulfide isomerase [Candidatus Niyogibacteria bacterium CG10_big_fil_rev_8_21_14_0_10_46_36]|uniref:Thiol-disulfide isomerase n=1 Tax=Candidatus Niyogibacteria bacterium CG10_big_fil_rev_8_21_14_0_10_46_36 TaxID=1974726 RepID=A0A2H0TCT8_9BACT|nr:MAG: thiol-disulfide isomerase [Candidatus Niyogibacteria bacterium CG10_big_fil_rev_8_21_14_0_10_46_36]
MTVSKQTIFSVVVLVLVVGAIVYLESRKADIPSLLGNQDVTILNEGERVAEKEKKFEPAKEISTPDGFINTDGVTISELIGKKIILVDFWTYSCINCQRTTPYLNSWYEKYADDGLVILGLHTPEFEFEKDYDNVARAVEKFGIEYPVVLDNDYSTWRSYENRYWPRKYLIDIDGFIVYDHIGEGAYEETEQKIVELLNERSAVLGEDAVTLDEKNPEYIQDVEFDKVQSPEMYFGYDRLQYIGNTFLRSCLDSVCDFDAKTDIQRNTFNLDGSWQIGPEDTVLKNGEGAIILGFSASKVNLVAGTDGGEIEAEIYLDGERVDAAYKGADVDENGVVRFGAHDLYNLIDLHGDYGEHVLWIMIKQPGLQAFAFTFG